jgi:hypothetical protein
MADMYNEKFYEEQRDFSLASAEHIVPLILEIFEPKAVCDLGCGTGAWLSVFMKNNVHDVTGYDINELSAECYFISKERIRTGFDICKKRLNCKTDMILCLEVAEHLPKANADKLVEELTNAAPVIIFSAAFPGQTGVNHINEQLPQYWRNKFMAHAYEEIDCIRPQIWYEKKVSWWLRQNITSFVSKKYLDRNEGLQRVYQKYGYSEHEQKLTLVNEHILENMVAKKRTTDVLRAYVRKWL